MKTHRIPITRRKFLKGMLATGLFWSMPGIFGCCQRNHRSLSSTEVLASLADTLFPGFPGIAQIRFMYYYRWTMRDPVFDADIKEMLRLGLAHFRRFANENNFTRQSQEKREKLLRQYISHHPGAQDWLGHLLRLIWESALLDPYYHINTGGVGWRWLGHKPGHPRPSAGAAYEDLISMKSHSEFISSPEDL